MYVKYATHCAWRAAYVYAGQAGNGRQLGYLGFDPNLGTGRRPQIFGGIAFGWPHRWSGFSFRFQIPALTWRVIAPRWLECDRGA